MWISKHDRRTFSYSHITRNTKLTNMTWLSVVHIEGQQISRSLLNQCKCTPNEPSSNGLKTMGSILVIGGFTSWFISGHWVRCARRNRVRDVWNKRKLSFIWWNYQTSFTSLFWGQFEGRNGAGGGGVLLSGTFSFQLHSMLGDPTAVWVWRSLRTSFISY